MVTPSEAEQTLKTIRVLMERATIYRAISAPVALVAAVLSLGLAAWGWFRPETFPGIGPFVLGWVAVLLVVLVLNFFLLKKDALRRGDPVVSPGMKLALRGALAPLSVAAVLTGVVVWHSEYPMFIAMFWVIFYGLALLSTREFAPFSVIRLGYGFLGFGLACLAFYPAGEDPIRAASLVMGLSFGLLHLVYAAVLHFCHSDESES